MSVRNQGLTTPEAVYAGVTNADTIDQVHHVEVNNHFRWSQLVRWRCTYVASMDQYQYAGSIYTILNRCIRHRWHLGKCRG